MKFSYQNPSFWMLLQYQTGIQELMLEEEPFFGEENNAGVKHSEKSAE